LVPRTVAESRPQAVDLAHPTSQTGTRGAGQSTHFWDDVEPLMEQEQHSDHSTATPTTKAGLTIVVPGVPVCGKVVAVEWTEAALAPCKVLHHPRNG